MSVMTLSVHGGLCCGVRHLHGFGQSPRSLNDYHRDEHGQILYGQDARPIPGDSKLESLTRILAEWNDPVNRAAHGPGNQRVIEVILTDRQVVGWHDTLLEHGFVKTYRFYNSNSRNHCNVYLKHADGVEVFAPNAAIQPPVAAPAAARELQVGDRVTYVGNSTFGNWNRRRNQPARVTYVGNDNISLRFDEPALRSDTGGDVIALRQNVRLIEEPAVAVAPAPAVEDPRIAVLQRQLDTMGTQREQAITERDAARRLHAEADAELQNVANELRALQNRPIEQAVVLTEYFADLRQTGRKGPFTTAEEARERYPRCRNIVRRTVFNNGNVLERRTD